MKQITLNINDSNFETFLEFIKTLDYVDIIDSTEIPEEHQQLIMDRFERYQTDTNRLLDWDEAQKDL
ncbi:MAG: hypothetical protein JEZ14_02220 [Marinilabiliaceae bacterium]|nr:hypothetical protein [Marinilabiliaceae bacterium]